MTVQFKANPVVTVAEARKILGDEAKDMTDDAIQQLVDDLDILAQYTIKMVQEFTKKDTHTD